MSRRSHQGVEEPTELGGLSRRIHALLEGQRRLPVSSHPSWPCPAPPSSGLPAPPLGQRRPPPPACGGLRPVPWSQAFPQGRSATAAVLLRAACRAGPPLQRRRSRG